jgi:hypothetical protein
VCLSYLLYDPFRGYPAIKKSSILYWMRRLHLTQGIPLVLLVATAPSLAALPAPLGAHSTPSTGSLATRNNSQDASIVESLKQDVASHPNDFITFETQTSASRFIEEHAAEAYRETQPRIASRGIFGYWRDKTLVVLPTLSPVIPSISQRKIN